MVLPMAAMRGHEFLIAVIHDVGGEGVGVSGRGGPSLGAAETVRVVEPTWSAGR